jgi:hypothetical protein
MDGVSILNRGCCQSSLRLYIHCDGTRDTHKNNACDADKISGLLVKRDRFQNEPVAHHVTVVTVAVDDLFDEGLLLLLLLLLLL